MDVLGARDRGQKDVDPFSKPDAQSLLDDPLVCGLGLPSRWGSPIDPADPDPG